MNHPATSPRKQNPTAAVFVLVFIAVLYFVIFIFPNSKGASDQQHILSGDEKITYPYIVHMLQPSSDIHDLWGRLIIYGDYHYGFPFYFLSYLSLLPLRLFSGDGFFDNVQLNLMILRQVINIIPILAAAFLLVYLQTRFRSLLKSAALFIFLLTIPGLVQQNIQWWHPDALTILSICLTIFFLDRDQLKFGRNFWLAAIACGLASAIKLQGIFFFLTIPGYILAGGLKKTIPWKRAALSAAAFVVLMSATILVSNPFLFYPSQFQKMLRIQSEKQVELQSGYIHDDPTYYQKGPQFWKWTLEKWYGAAPLLLFLAAGLLASCYYPEKRALSLLLLSWCLPLSLYLLYGVAPKPSHYFLPVMLPLFSSAFAPLEILNRLRSSSSKSKNKVALTIGLGAVSLILLYWFAVNLSSVYQLWISGMLVG